MKRIIVIVEEVDSESVKRAEYFISWHNYTESKYPVELLKHAVETADARMKPVQNDEPNKP